MPTVAQGRDGIPRAACVRMPRGLGQLLWLLALLCSTCAARAQLPFDVWTESNGLPQTYTREIAQTPDGYLWISTLDGLVRFDGVRFTTFNHGSTLGIVSNRFEQMYRDARGDLWLTSESGRLTRYHNGAFHTFANDGGIAGGRVGGIAGDDAGHVWILLDDIVAEWDESSGRFNGISSGDRPSGYFTFLWEKTGFWEGDSAGLHCFIDGHFVTYKLPAPVAHASVKVAARDRDGTIWVEMKNGKLFEIVNGKATEPVSTKDAALSYRDSTGHLWPLQVDGELNRQITIQSSGRNETIPFNWIFEDSEQNLWLAGRGLHRLQNPPFIPGPGIRDSSRTMFIPSTRIARDRSGWEPCLGV